MNRLISVTFILSISLLSSLYAQKNTIVTTQQKLSKQYQQIREVDNSIKDLLDAKTHHEQSLEQLTGQLTTLEAKLQKASSQKQQTKELIQGTAIKLYQLANHRSHVTLTYSKYYLNKLVNLHRKYQDMLDTTHQIMAKKKSKQQEISAILAKQKSVLRQLDQSRNRQQKVIQSLQKQLLSQSHEHQQAPTPQVTKHGSTGFKKTKHHLPWPIRGEILQHFGQHLAGHIQADAILISASQGEPVHAVHDGWVVHAGWLPQYGFLIIIDHGDHYYSLYGHNEQILVSVGNHVACGDTIAKAGRTGGQEQDMLYFAIKHKLNTEDPEKWLVKPS